MLLLATAASLSFVAASGCKSSSPAADPAEAGGSAAASASASAASSGAPRSPLAIPGATVVAVGGEPFPERFAGETAGRPPGIKPRVEDVYAALSAGGLGITGQKQHLASPLGARYCVGAQAVSDAKETVLQISVCECSTPEVAQVARDFTTKTANIPLRTVYVNKQTMLVLREEKSSPEIDALVTKASDLFAKL
jgi:hypothetical protein